MRCLKGIALVLVVALTFVMGGCSPSETEAKKAFENMMNAFKACDENAIDEYYSFSAVTSYVDEKNGKEYRDAVLTTLKKMDYKINSANTSGENSVIINVDITTLDFSEIINRYIDEVMGLVGSKEYQLKVKSMTADEYKTIMAGKMVDAINNSDVKTVTKSVDVMMIKSGDAWVLGGEADVFLGTLFADMSNAVQSLT